MYCTNFMYTLIDVKRIFHMCAVSIRDRVYVIIQIILACPLNELLLVSLIVHALCAVCTGKLYYSLHTLRSMLELRRRFHYEFSETLVDDFLLNINEKSIISVLMTHSRYETFEMMRLLVMMMMWMAILAHLCGAIIIQRYTLRLYTIASRFINHNSSTPMIVQCAVEFDCATTYILLGIVLLNISE